MPQTVKIVSEMLAMIHDEWQLAEMRWIGARWTSLSSFGEKKNENETCEKVFG